MNGHCGTRSNSGGPRFDRKSLRTSCGVFLPQQPTRLERDAEIRGSFLPLRAIHISSPMASPPDCGAVTRRGHHPAAARITRRTRESMPDRSAPPLISPRLDGLSANHRGMLPEASHEGDAVGIPRVAALQRANRDFHQSRVSRGHTTRVSPAYPPDASAPCCPRSLFRRVKLNVHRRATGVDL